MSEKLDGHALNQLFLTARTRNGWTDRPVSEAQIRELYDVFKFGPTSANSCPARFVWVMSAAGKQKLSALASEGNKAKILAAPLTVIIGHDLDFAEQMPKLFPARGEAMRDMFRANAGDGADRCVPQRQPAGRLSHRGGARHGARLRADVRLRQRRRRQRVLRRHHIKSNFICCLGYGSDIHLHPRNPRLSFEEAGRFA
jgi:3-hydroxypropanoate dehydrogenase